MQQNRPYWHMKVARYSFSELRLSDPLLMLVLPHTVLGAEVILESYYSNQFMTGNSPLQLVQWSTVPNKKKTSIWYPSLITRNSPCDNNKKHGNVFKNWLCPNFLLLPKKSELPKLRGAAAPIAPPARTPMDFAYKSKAYCLFITREFHLALKDKMFTLFIIVSIP